MTFQPAFSYSKSTMETTKQCIKSLKVNNADTMTTWLMSLWCLYCYVNFKQISHIDKLFPWLGELQTPLLKGKWPRFQTLPGFVANTWLPSIFFQKIKRNNCFNSDLLNMVLVRKGSRSGWVFKLNAFFKSCNGVSAGGLIV